MRKRPWWIRALCAIGLHKKIHRTSFSVCEHCEWSKKR